MEKSYRVLRNGNFNDVAYLDRTLKEFFLGIVMAAIGSCALAAFVWYSPPPHFPSPASAAAYPLCIIPFAILFLSFLFGAIYWTALDHRYYLADWPEEGILKLAPLAMMLAYWPFILVSYIALRRTRRNYRAGDIAGRELREQRHSETRKAREGESAEDQEVAQAALNEIIQDCWRQGGRQDQDRLIAKQVELKRQAAKLKSQEEALETQLVQLQNAQIQIQVQLNSIETQLQADPDERVMAPEVGQDLAHCRESLYALPEVARVEAWHGHGGCVVSQLRIELHISDDPQAPRYDFGDYLLIFRNDGAGHYSWECEHLRTGMTMNGRALDSERDGWQILQQKDLQAALRERIEKGNIVDATQVLARLIRSYKTDELTSEELGQYYLPLWPLRDR